MVLTEVGLTSNEAKVYVSLLRVGEGSATKVADAAKMHRPNVYDSVERLIEKGFVSYRLLGRTKVFKAAEPKRLLDSVVEKEEKLKKVLPTLELEKGLSEVKSHAETYEGIRAFRQVLTGLLDYRKTIYAFGIPGFVPDIVKDFICHFHKQRIKIGLEMKHIYNDDAKERIEYLNSLEHTSAAYLPEEYNTPTTTIVCGDEILLVGWKPLVFVRIVNRGLADGYQRYCELMLRSARGGAREDRNNRIREL